MTPALSLKGSEKDTRSEALRLGAEAKATAGQRVNLRAEARGDFSRGWDGRSKMAVGANNG